jgi:mannan endo-1,4-beta-mannosidase
MHRVSTGVNLLMDKKPFVVAALAVLAGAALFLAGAGRGAQKRARPGFVATDGVRFVLDGEPFRFVGANVAVMYKDEDRVRMPETLRVAAADGAKVIRVWAYGEGGADSRVKSLGEDRNDWPRQHPFRFAPDQWNEEAFVHLDRVMAEAERNGLKVQLCLVNWWRDTGGVTQYLTWAGVADAADDSQPFGIHLEKAHAFYTNERARAMFREHVRRVVLRKNTVTGRVYKDDPTVFGWELMNEAQATTGRRHERLAWVREMSEYVKSLDPDHLLTPGLWGYRASWERREWLAEHRLPTVDFIDVHHYPAHDTDSFVDSPAALREFLDNRVAAAWALQKPLVMGEFGMWPEGFAGVSEADWYRAYLDHCRRAGVAGAMYWILTPDPQRGYGVSYTSPRDAPIHAVLKEAAADFAAHQADLPPRRLQNTTQHLILRQFEFTRAAGDPLTEPDRENAPDGVARYSFRPEGAAQGRFERLGGGRGYVWGNGMGFFEYVLPSRSFRRTGRVTVRANLQPVEPFDAQGRIRQTTVNLFLNGVDCGPRNVALADPKVNIVEWQTDAWRIRFDAWRGAPLHLRFAVQPDAAHPYGLNISNWPVGYDPQGHKPLEIDLQ